MLRRPKALPVDASVGRARESLTDQHVHMVLLVDHEGRLAGTVVREDLEGARAEDQPALEIARLEGRTVSPSAPAGTVHDELLRRGLRRLAVVSTEGRLEGLVCLKRHLSGFCSAADVEARAAAGRSEGVR